MTFRIDDLSVSVSISAAGGQPGGCTCGPASGAGQPPPCANSRRPGGQPGKPGGPPPKKRALDALRTQLRGSLPSPM
ncbi:MAG: hypothetical protein ABUT39_19535 [Acidobacteriota bacterium]